MEKPSFESEATPIIEKKSDSIEKSLKEFEKLLATDVKEWKSAFFYGIGELVSSDIYDYTDYTKYWTNNNEDPQDNKFASEAVKKAFISSQEIVAPEVVERYFLSPKLGSDNQTLAMLKELGKVRDEQTKWYIFKIILDTKLDQLSQLEESKKEFSQLVTRLMRGFEFRLSTIREGKDVSRAVFDYLQPQAPKLNFDELVPIWKSRIKHQILPARTIGLDIERALELENALPGSTERLIKEFGIENIGRYPVSLLLEQIDQKENYEIPYGVFLSTEADWNNSLHMGSETIAGLLDSLQQQGMTLRIAEFNGNVDFVRKLKNFDSIYGNRQRIRFGVLNAHGNQDGMRMGGTNRDGNNQIYTFDQRNLNEREEKALEYIRSFFADEATLILASCSVGKENGVAQTISKIMNIKVLGPIENSSAQEIKVLKSEGGISFEVIYKGADDKEIKTNCFENGEIK